MRQEAKERFRRVGLVLAGALGVFDIGAAVAPKPRPGLGQYRSAVARYFVATMARLSDEREAE